jgi:Tol biopolymer transport system component
MKARRTGRIVALALLAAAAVVEAGAQDAAATTPGKNGRLAFRRYFDVSQTWGAIFVSAADGTGALQITHPKRGVLDDQPDWSPDGSLLVFHRCSAGEPCAIYTVRPDGSQLKRLSGPVTPDLVDDSEGSFTSDGHHVVFTRASGGVKSWGGGDEIRHSDLVVTDLNGKHRRVIAGSAPYQADYEFAMNSPDGSQFVFEHWRSHFADPHMRRALIVASADGRHTRRITPWALNAGDGADWSPDGTHILFRSNDDEDDVTQSQIYTVRPDGSELEQLTSFPDGTQLLSSTFSPDGTKIVFAKADAGGQADLFVMNADGTGIQPILQSALWESAPDWGTG